MNPHPPPSRPNLDLPELTRRTLADLELEEAALTATLDGVRRLRAALRHGDSGALADALQQQDDDADPAAARAARRQRLRHDWASVLGTSPDAVTLTLLAGRVPAEDRPRFTRLHVRLTELAAEVDAVNRGNAALAGHCLDFVRGLLVDFTGGQLSPRYSPSGAQLDTACGSLIEARG